MSATAVRPRLARHPGRTRPHTASRPRRPAAVAATKAEYFYDYAGQDPINGYDLSGTVMEAVDAGAASGWTPVFAAAPGGGTVLLNPVEGDASDWTSWTPSRKGTQKHAAAIATVASFLSMIPGVDVVAVPTALAFGVLAGYNDRHDPLALGFDVAGLVSGGYAVTLTLKASQLERAASDAWMLGPVGGWLRQDAAALRGAAFTISFTSFGISAVGLHPHP